MYIHPSHAGRFYPFPLASRTSDYRLFLRGPLQPLAKLLLLNQEFTWVGFSIQTHFVSPAINHVWQSLAHEIGQCCSCPVTPIS